MPQEEVEGMGGHVEVGEGYEGGEDGAGGECRVEQAACVAKRVSEDGKRDFGEGQRSQVIRSMRGQREAL